MRQTLRIATRAIGIIVFLVVSAFTFHYYGRLRLLENQPLVVVPGKWVWVECQTTPFAATIEEVGVNGIVLVETAQVHTGLSCEDVGITRRGGKKYYFPFRAVLGLEVDGRSVWSNPFPM